MWWIVMDCDRPSYTARRQGGKAQIGSVLFTSCRDPRPGHSGKPLVPASARIKEQGPTLPNHLLVVDFALNSHSPYPSWSIHDVLSDSLSWIKAFRLKNLKMGCKAAPAFFYGTGQLIGYSMPKLEPNQRQFQRATNFVSCLDLRSSTRSYWHVLAAPFTPKKDGISLSHAQKCQTNFVDRPLISSKCRAKRLGLRCFVLQHTWKALRQLLCQVAVGTKSKIPRLGLQEQNQAANVNEINMNT